MADLKSSGEGLGSWLIATDGPSYKLNPRIDSTVQSAALYGPCFEHMKLRVRKGDP